MNGDGRFKIVDGKIYDGEYQELTIEQVCKKLNDYEQTRLRKNKDIQKFKDREDRFQRVIGGMMAYMELQANSELWWDWNDY